MSSTQTLVKIYNKRVKQGELSAANKCFKIKYQTGAGEYEDVEFVKISKVTKITKIKISKVTRSWAVT